MASNGANPVATAEQQVIAAVRTLYHQQDQEQRKKAELWLKDFQIKAKIAWVVADQLLRSEAAGQEAHFYAAQTLHMRIQIYGHKELQAESRASLRQSLVEHMLRHRNSSPALMTKLSLCVATLALHMGAEWPNIIQDLLNAFTQANALRCFFSVLIVLPEECFNHAVRASRENKDFTEKQLQAAAPGVFSTLVGFMTQAAGNHDAQSQVFRCLSSWLALCTGSLPYSALVGNPLVAACFDALSSHALFDAALEAACGLVSLSICSDEYAPLREFIMGRVASVFPLYQKAAHDDDEDTARGVCRLFSETGESYMELIAASPTVLPIIGHMLECTANMHTSVSSQTFPFWQLLASGMKSEDMKSKRGNYAVVFMQLIDTLMKTSQFPPDYETLPKDLQADFREFRNGEFTDLLRVTCDLVGPDVCLERITSTLMTRFNEFSRTQDWRPVEACLYNIRAISRYTDMTKPLPVGLRHVLTVIPNLPQQGPLQYTALLIVGICSQWLKSEPSLFANQLLYTLGALTSVENVSAAAVAFRNICSACPELVGNGYLQPSFTAIAGMKAARLEDHQEVMGGIGHVMSVMANAEQFTMCLQCACTPLIQPLQAADTAPNVAADCLARLATLVENIRTKLPVLIIQPLWTVLEPIFGRYHNSHTVIQELCRVFRYGARSFLHEFTPPFLAALSQSILACFNSSHSPYLLRLTRSLASHGIADPAQTLAGLINALAGTAFSFLNTQQAVDDDPDTALELAELLQSFITQSGTQQGVALAGPALEWSLFGVLLAHRNANRSIMDLLDAMLKDPNAVVRLPHVGPTLVSRGITAAVEAVNRSQVVRASQSLYKVKGIHKSEFSAWLNAAVASNTTIQRLVPHADQTILIQKLLVADDRIFNQVLVELFVDLNP